MAMSSCVATVTTALALESAAAIFSDGVAGLSAHALDRAMAARQQVRRNVTRIGQRSCGGDGVGQQPVRDDAATGSQAEYARAADAVNRFSLQPGNGTRTVGGVLRCRS